MGPGSVSDSPPQVRVRVVRCAFVGNGCVCCVNCCFAFGLCEVKGSFVCATAGCVEKRVCVHVGLLGQPCDLWHSLLMG